MQYGIFYSRLLKNVQQSVGASLLGVGQHALNRTRILNPTILKIRREKSEWQKYQESRFVKLVENVPTNSLQFDLIKSNLDTLCPALKTAMKLENGTDKQIASWKRKKAMGLVVQTPGDTTSLQAQLASLTVNIHFLRKQAIETPGDTSLMRKLDSKLSNRFKVMRNFFFLDYIAYRHACRVLHLTPVSFGIPKPTTFDKQPSHGSVDGSAARWAIQRRLFRGKFQPEPNSPLPGQKTTRYSEWPASQTEIYKHKPVPQQISSKYPYGIADHYIDGSYEPENQAHPSIGHMRFTYSEKS